MRSNDLAMKVIDILKRIEVTYSTKNREVYAIPIEDQMSYLNSLKEPINDSERSYNQYCCQMFSKGKAVKFISNIMCALLTVFLKAQFINKKVIPSDVADAVFLADGKSEDIIPISLRKEYPNIVKESRISYCLTKDDIKYLSDIKAIYPGENIFLFKILIKLARYRYLIERFKPKALIICNEYSFTSSMMCDFCHANKIKLINVMHGEKLLHIKDSFFRFDKCYIWDEYYKELFIKLRAYKEQFIIEIPDSFKIPDADSFKEIDFTYYLQDENDRDLEIIMENLLRLNRQNCRVAIRPHPRFSNVKHIREKICGKLEVEDTKLITIHKSLARTKNAISLCSTVLNQAYYNGINIVIDDVTKPNEYEKLKKLEYIMTYKEHSLLSSYLKNRR